MKTYKGGLVVVSCFLIASALIACSPQQSTQVSTAEWSADSDCSVCHSAENQSLQDAACLASEHGTQACVTCHTDTATLETVHDEAGEGANAPTDLRVTSVGEAVCLGCHGSYEELAQKTGTSTVLTDSEGTVVNPHDVTNRTPSHADISCSSCHDMHSNEGVSTTAPALCVTCHHENVYQCGTCH